MKLFSFKTLRILTLLTLLGIVATYTQGQRLTSQGWYKPLQVSIFPINGDGSIDTAEYITNLNSEDFAEIDAFMARESQRYKIITSIPTKTSLGPVIEHLPPSPPDADSNTLAIMLWSLKLRWWAYKNTPNGHSDKHRVRIFVLYHRGANGVALQHSLGLQKGLIGIVHAYAQSQQNPQNNIVIAHELLHTVGAADKYDERGLPLFPLGYTEPNKDPRYPQRRAEIMAGRIPLSSEQWRMPDSLREVAVGPETAREVHWAEGEE